MLFIVSMWTFLVMEPVKVVCKIGERVAPHEGIRVVEEDSVAPENFLRVPLALVKLRQPLSVASNPNGLASPVSFVDLA